MTPGRNLKFTAHRCAGGECPVIAVEEADCTADPTFWSDPDAWTTTQMVPMEGDDLVIESGWNMYLDISGDTPIFNKIEINGCLTF